MDLRSVLTQLEEGGGDLAAQLAYLAAQEIEIDEGDLGAARRRALLVLASGGDPRRELDLESRAVTVIAEDLRRPSRLVNLQSALAGLRQDAEGLAGVSATLDELLADSDLAWRWACCALLAEELADGGA